ncbi:MAG: TSUP family transporter [Burkholderiales bacterium]
MERVIGRVTNTMTRRAALTAHGVIGLIACIATASVVTGIITGSPTAQIDAAITAWIFIAAILASICGFAFGPIAGAGLVATGLSPVAMVGLVVVCSITIQSYGLVALHSAMEWRRALPFAAGGLLTVPFGVAILQVVPMSTFQITLGTILVAYASFALMPFKMRSIRASRSGDFVTGALGGLVGGLSGFPSAPIVIWCGLQGLSKTFQRGICQPYILTMQLATVAWMQRGFDFSGIERQLILAMPVALLAATLGVGVFRKLSNAAFSRVVNVLLMAAGIVLIARPVLAMV